MKKIINSIFVLSLSLLFITSCKKDEETTVNNTNSNTFEVSVPKDDTVRNFNNFPIDGIAYNVAFIINADTKIKSVYIAMLDVNNDTVRKYDFSSVIGKTSAAINIQSSFGGITLNKYPLKIKASITDNNNKSITKSVKFNLNYIPSLPNITFANNINEVELTSVPSNYELNYVAEAKGQIKNINLKITNGQGVSSNYDVSSLSIPGDTSYTGVCNLSYLEAAKFPYTIAVEVKDMFDITTTKIFTLKLKQTNVFTGNTWSNKILGASGSSSYGSFFGAVTGLTYTTTMVISNTSNIDMIFDNLVTNKAALQLYSPKIANTNYKATKFGVTTIDFATVTDEQLSAINVSNDKVAVVTNGVYAFITQEGKKGIVKVNSITGTGASANLNFDVKVQK